MHRLVAQRALGVARALAFGFEMFLEQLGQAEPSLNRLVRCAYSLLGLQTHFATGAKDAGKMRAEGKEYIVKDGDVMNFLFSP
jgi:ribosome-binding ATPase YchF (GTP1/OBG family)